ncbi:MAG: DUF3300 domain-containing protein [Nitrospirae bacterium]|nr:DUF3300 domain-containing protein [Nitrospirota bacterium]
MSGIAVLIISLLALPSRLPAQDIGEQQQTYEFKKEELAQMLASIALYPDTLIADILMASTYPIEVVEAERWLRQNRSLKGDAFDGALQVKTWDASVKVLCHFPEIIFTMSEKLDQTRKLGDAFLSQQEDVMDMIQELRRKAVEQGNLKTTREQTVIEDQDGIRIKPSDPVIVYVPVYDPFYIYGPWWYPYYPPYYWYYPSGTIVVGGNINFGSRFYVGIDLFSWQRFDWPRRVIHIDRDRERRFGHFDRNRRGLKEPYWRHDTYHRRGVAYRDMHTAERYGIREIRPQAKSPEMRGYQDRRFKGPEVTPSSGQEQRLDVHPAMRRSQGKPALQNTRGSNLPFQGIGNGNFERRASERGEVSRQRENKIRQDGNMNQRGGNTGSGGNRKDGRFGR